ncbi:MAG TPA: hypothetical protein VG013_31045 [Gemmataceae bacterium]|jgi:hypothetical protein|nr:hypothetical protein [Gemmataceae bacterium]
MYLPSPRRNNFLPRLEALEDRVVPSVFSVHTPPRTGGAAFQTGSLLTVDLRNKVDQPGLNTVTIIDDGKGDIQVSWDGGPVHSFTGVSQIVVNSARTITEQVGFELTGPLAAPLNVQLNLNGINNVVTEQVGNNGVLPSGLTFDIVTLRHNGDTEVNVTS